MTIEAITRKSQQAAVPFAVAKQIRALLDEARKQYGEDEWDCEDVQSTVIELVTEDE